MHVSFRFFARWDADFIQAMHISAYICFARYHWTTRRSGISTSYPGKGKIKDDICTNPEHLKYSMFKVLHR